MRRIIDAKYKKYDLNKVVTKQCQHANAEKRKRLLILLKKFKDLFNGTLGAWNTTPVDSELKDDEKLVCSQPYQAPRLKEVVFRK